MNEAKHTPGPWVVDKYQRSDSCTLSVSANHWQVAQATGWGGDKASEADANARLIAAAPDLLTALKGFVSLEFTEASENLAEGIGTAEDYDLVVKTFDAARAAIAKAEGKEAK